MRGVCPRLGDLDLVTFDIDIDAKGRVQERRVSRSPRYSTEGVCASTCRLSTGKIDDICRPFPPSVPGCRNLLGCASRDRYSTFRGFYYRSQIPAIVRIFTIRQSNGDKACHRNLRRRPPWLPQAAVGLAWQRRSNLRRKALRAHETPTKRTRCSGESNRPERGARPGRCLQISGYRQVVDALQRLVKRTSSRLLLPNACRFSPSPARPGLPHR